MPTFLLFAVFAQVVVPGPAQPAAPEVLTWTDGQRRYTSTPSTTLVAEPSPSEAGATALRALGAELRVDRPTVRLWQVRDVAAARAKWPALLEVFHDGRHATGRVRVPLALVCGARREVLPAREVFARSGANCLPDFWYPPVPK